MEEEVADTKHHHQLMQKIAKILDETRTSNATHNRKLKDLLALRSQPKFFSAFSKTLIPLFNFERRSPSVERVVRFVSVFAASTDNKDCSDESSFLNSFLQFLLVAATSANKTARFRACQFVSEIILRLPDDADVCNQLWDEVIESMMIRVKDKAPIIRVFAIRALSRFVNDAENSDILDLLLEALSLEQSVDVRKTIVLSLPPSSATVQAIIDCTQDVSESVRKAAYCVLANKFPLQSLSIKHRTIILQRGLADRSAAVSKECMNLMKDEWLVKCCKGDPLELLKYLDVETYDLVGESVMEALLKADAIRLHEPESIQKYIGSALENSEVGNSADCPRNIQLMEAEAALYWRTVCRHLQMEAQEKGSGAAVSTGAEAAVYAAEASDKNELLDRILPATISDYLDLVKAHLDAGLNYKFVAQQLLLLGSMLDFSDATNIRAAGAFVRELLAKPLEYEVDDNMNVVTVGDGINLGGDREWANTVSCFAKKVHSASGEFEEVVLQVVEELAQPCRERTADPVQWMHCLALIGLLLENTKSFRCIQGRAIQPDEILHSLLLPGAKHVHLDVQRVAVRCLGLFGLLERKTSPELLKQLRISYIKGPPPISRMACQALMDLVMWHGPQEVDGALGKDLPVETPDGESTFASVNFSNEEGSLNIEILNLLYAGFDRDEWTAENDENESVCAVLGEGFAKILLLSSKFRSIKASVHCLLLAKLIFLFFSNETKDLYRLRQCLSVFFENYPSISANHKEHISKAFIPAIRLMWPGIDGNVRGSPVMISNMRKRAVQASRFMLQMMQAPLYEKETEKRDECGEPETANTAHNSAKAHEMENSSSQLKYEYQEDGLAIRIATEVAGFSKKKTAAEKSYISALCRILVLINFKQSEQEVIKLMRRLLSYVSEAVSTEKDLLRDLKQLDESLKKLDRHPDHELLQEQADIILRRLGLDFKLDVCASVPVLQTPAPCSTRPNRTRRRAKQESSSSDEECSSTSVAPAVLVTVSARSQRASKTAALTKITARKIPKSHEEGDEDEQVSDVTSEEDSEESDGYTE